MKTYNQFNNPVDFYFAYFTVYFYLKACEESIEDKNLDLKIELLNKYAYKSFLFASFEKDLGKRKNIFLEYREKVLRKLLPYIIEDKKLFNLLYKQPEIEIAPKIKSYPNDVVAVSWSDYYGI